MAELPHDEEILDLVDYDDQVIGQVTHEQAFDIKNDGSGYLRAVNAFIINSEGKLWIPRRTAEKRIAPNGLDFSVGEHVMTGESYDDAIIRGFEEELNMDVTLSQLENFCTTKPKPDSAPYITVNYLMHSDISPDYSTTDFVSADWISPDDLVTRMKNGELGKQSLIEVAEALLGYISENSRH